VEAEVKRLWLRVRLTGGFRETPLLALTRCPDLYLIFDSGLLLMWVPPIPVHVCVQPIG
jgi:hypothetical protein